MGRAAVCNFIQRSFTHPHPNPTTLMHWPHPSPEGVDWTLNVMIQRRSLRVWQVGKQVVWGRDTSVSPCLEILATQVLQASHLLLYLFFR